MIIWLNGTFGAGKTTVASRLLELASGFRVFDPEFVGYLLMNAGQDIRPWRHNHVEPYLAARSWLFDSADLVVDTAVVSPVAAAAKILRTMDPPVPPELRENAGSELRATCVFPQFAGEGEETRGGAGVGEDEGGEGQR